MDWFRSLVFNNVSLIERILVASFPTVYWKVIHDDLVGYINQHLSNILDSSLCKIIFAILMSISCVYIAFWISKKIASFGQPSPNILEHHPVYDKFLTNLKDELGKLKGINRNHVKNFRFSVYREFRDCPRKGQTKLFCCSRINEDNGGKIKPRIWTMANDSNGKNAGIVGLSLSRTETIHLMNELKSFESLKNMLSKNESLKEYAEILNIDEKVLKKDLKSHDESNVDVHRYPRELVCIASTNLPKGKRLILVLDCGIPVSSRAKKNGLVVRKLEEMFLDFQEDILKENESFHYLYKLKNKRDYFLRGVFSRL